MHRLDFIIILEFALMHGSGFLILNGRLLPIKLELVEKVLHLGTLKQLAATLSGHYAIVPFGILLRIQLLIGMHVAVPTS